MQEHQDSHCKPYRVVGINQDLRPKDGPSQDKQSTHDNKGVVSGISGLSCYIIGSFVIRVQSPFLLFPDLLGFEPSKYKRRQGNSNEAASQRYLTNVQGVDPQGQKRGLKNRADNEASRCCHLFIPLSIFQEKHILNPQPEYPGQFISQH